MSERMESAKTFGSVAIYVVLTFVFVAIMLPGPLTIENGVGLDHSWSIGLQEAIARGMVMGEDVIFTFGPFSSVFTTQYHPATVKQTVVGCLVLAGGYSLALGASAQSAGAGRVMLAAILILAFFYQRDTLLLAYPLVVAVMIYLRYLRGGYQVERGEMPLLIGVLIPFGLLPLVKGTAIIAVTGTVVFTMTGLVLAEKRCQAVLMIVVPALAMAAFWLGATHELHGLAKYFITMVPIVTGYSDAMAISGPVEDIVVYLVACSIVLASLLFGRDDRLAHRLPLALCFLLFLFVSFKAAFVRHDGHALIAASSVGFAAALIVVLRRSFAVVVLAASIFSWLYLDAMYARTTTERVLERFSAIVRTVEFFGSAAADRASGELDDVWRRRRQELLRQCSNTKLEGDVDVYSYGQACLILSDNEWNPRPIIQSYSAYTPKLAELNAEHLLRENAPRNVVFRVEPIDGRLPSLEDGPSWPLLLHHYAPTALTNDVLYLRRSASNALLEITYGRSRMATVEEEVPVVHSGQLVVAKVRLHKTVYGRLMSLVFKSGAPSIEVTRRDGARLRYRLVPGMAEAGFLITPHVASTRDFAMLFDGQPETFGGRQVISFRIQLDDEARPHWKPTYSVELAVVKPQLRSAQAREVLLSRGVGAPALKAAAPSSIGCDGAIDRVNGWGRTDAPLPSGTTAVVDGWAAASTAAGVVADEVLVTARSKTGQMLFFPTTRVDRPDVASHFRQKALARSGFEARIDLTGLGADVEIGIAAVLDAGLKTCEVKQRMTVSQ